MTRQIEEIIKEREKKLKKIESFFGKAFPLTSKKTHSVAKFLENFKKLEKKKEEVFLVGRIIAQRIHGKISFLDLYEEGEKVQLVVAQDKVGESSYQNFLDLVDVGDILEVRGIAFTTKRGEKSLEVLDWKILAKSLRPLPEKWHGLKDVEERYRKRYLDLIFNKEVREKFILRSKIISEIRKFLEKEGFLEVETPILQTVYGGGRAKPFETYLNALDLKLYLRIAPELYLKRLLVGGFEKIFEIGKCFRNEGMDRFHNPDFTVLEFYWAFADYKMLMKLTERMFKYLLRKLFKKQKIVYQGKEINFKTPFERIEFDVLFRKETGIDYDTVNRDTLLKKAKELDLKVDEKSPKFEIADEIFKKIIRPKIWNPTFIIHYPLGFQVLAKALENRPERLANFQLIVAGIELVNAFSELNDPIEQRKRFKEQQKLKKEGFEEAHPFDEDFLEALEYGMPPAAGFGMGIDRLVMLLTDSYSLREAILFPTMKPK
jgi:lysyl-tRNA synthetase class 2